MGTDLTREFRDGKFDEDFDGLGEWSFSGGKRRAAQDWKRNGKGRNGSSSSGPNSSDHDSVESHSGDIANADSESEAGDAESVNATILTIDRDRAVLRAVLERVCPAGIISQQVITASGFLPPNSLDVNISTAELIPILNTMLDENVRLAARRLLKL